MKIFFVNEFEEILRKYIGIIDKEPVSNNEIKELNEFGFLILDVIKILKLRVQDKIMLERLLSRINNKIYIGERIFYYSSLYYLPQKFYTGEPEEIGRATYKANIDINVMRLQIKCGRVNGSSEDDYFFSRGESGLLRAVNNLLDHSNDLEVLIPAFYLLLNYSQAIMEYLESDGDLYRKESEELVVYINNTIYKFLEKECIVQRVNKDFQIKFFMLNELRRHSKVLNKSFNVSESEVSEFKSYSNVNKKIWAYLNYIYIKKDKFIEEFKNDFDRNYCTQINRVKNIEKVVLLRSCLAYLAEENDISVGEIKIPVFEFYKKNDWFSLKDYFKGYGHLDSIIVSQEDFEKVDNLSNKQLVNLIGQAINGVNPNIIRREISKIYNENSLIKIELPLKSSFQLGTYYMYIILNSKKEITSEISEEIASRIYKPFINCGEKAIVVFVSIHSGTDIIYDEVKRFSDYINWTVERITCDTFIKLLKYNKLI